MFYNNYDTSGGEYGYYRSVHSHFQMLADMGFVVAFVCLSLLLLSTLNLYRIGSKAKMPNIKENDFYINISTALMASVVAFLIGGAFYEAAYNDLIWLFFAVIIATERQFKKDQEKIGEQ